MTESMAPTSLIKVDADMDIAGRPEVLAEIAKVADETVKTLADYVLDFINVRFPEGLPPAMHSIVTDLVIDAFHDGARWAEQQKTEESRIILQG